MKWIICGLMILFGSPILLAQNWYHAHLTKSDGLPSNEIFNVYQDQRGYIWIASEEGLTKYDGIHFKNYSTPHMSSKSGSYIKEDGYGRIWYGNFDGQLYYVESDSLKPLANKPLASIPAEFFLRGDTLIYVDRNHYLTGIELKKDRIYSRKQIDKRYTNFYQFDNRFQITSENGVTFFNTQLEITSFIPKINQDHASKVIPYKDKLYSLIYSNHEVLIHEMSGNVIRKIYHEKQSSLVQGFFIVDQSIWVLKRDGVIKMNLDGTAIVKMFPNESASHIIKDRKGYLWITTSNNGIYILPPTNGNKEIPLPLQTFEMRSRNGHIFLFDKVGNIFVLQNNLLKPVLQLPSKNSFYDIIQIDPSKITASSLPSDNFTLFDYQGSTFMAISTGVKAFSKLEGHLGLVSASGFVGIFNPNQSKRDSNRIWDKFVWQKKYDTSTLHSKNISPILLDVRSKCNSYDQDNKIAYFSTNIGLFALNPDTLEELRYQQKPLFISKLISAKGKNFFLSTVGEIYYRPQKEALIKLDGLNKIGPFKLIHLKENTLICISHREIRFLDIPTKLNETTSFTGTYTNKLPIHDVNNIETHEDQLYLGLSNKLIILDSLQTSELDLFNFGINEIYTPGKHLPYEPHTKISFRENNVSIGFSLQDYYHSIRTLEYQINDEQWIGIDVRSNLINLASLAPASYKVRFRINGAIQKDLALFIIQKPWYLSWSFLAFLFLLTGIATYAFYSNKLKKNKQKSHLELEKAMLEKNLRQSMLSSIKAQMNPHFLFNALNTIQSYILTEDKDNAANYLSKFSKLTRKILEMSDKERVSLQEEIDALILYIELEKMRFDDLNFTIQIAKDLNPEKVGIPSMIIQPYVENAIKHGLLHKPSDKNLSIHIHRKEQILIIEIEDNGIGRVRSEQINKNKPHHSFAAHANMKRIELLNLEKNNIGVAYTDKYDSGNQATGTLVTIQIPLEA